MARVSGSGVASQCWTTRPHHFLLRVRRAGPVALLAGVIVGCSSAPSSVDLSRARRLPEFIFGTAATDINADAMATAAQIGYRWIRVPIRWNMLEPTVTELPALTLGELAANPALVDEFARRADWSIPDAALAHASQLGLHVIGFVGASSPPTFGGAPLDPARLGAETYLAEQGLVTRAIVKRYGHDRVNAPRSAATVELWQTENELNIASAATLIGWRTPAGPEGFFRSPWADWNFLTDLLRTLREAVLAVDPEALTEININLDMHDNFNTKFGRPGWEETVSSWRTLADVIGFDTYPNYYASHPVDGTVVGVRAQRILELVSPGQQVMVVETGYPNGPSARGYSPDDQARYLSDAWASAHAAGVSGFMPFAIADSAGPDPTYTLLDQVDLDILAQALKDGDVVMLASLFLGQSRWMTSRMPALTQAVEGRWGVYGPRGEELPALKVVRDIASETSGW